MRKNKKGFTVKIMRVHRSHENYYNMEPQDHYIQLREVNKFFKNIDKFYDDLDNGKYYPKFTHSFTGEVYKEYTCLVELCQNSFNKGGGLFRYVKENYPEYLI